MLSALSDTDSALLSPADIRERQADDPDLKPIYVALQQSKPQPSWNEIVGESKEAKAYWNQWPFLELIDGILYRRRPASGTQGELLQVIMPEAHRQETMSQAHAGFGGGHLGERRTIEQVRRRAYWIGWAKDVRAYCKRCDACTCYWRGKAPRARTITTDDDRRAMGTHWS